ncbi:MAG: efflux RND transporter periplasmic adaptor subunit [Nevskiaceae bacterium]|nr:MAG: efflux RND transporter periplasmic adaptor subunit [Nevskiaceae bacterium]
MKNPIKIAALVILSAAAGAGTAVWVVQHRSALVTPVGEMNMVSGEDSHGHFLTPAKDAQGKTYYTCAMHPQVHSDKPGQCPICGMPLIKKVEAPSEKTPLVSGERKPLYWYDPMKPDQHFDRPGKSPFMDMQLLPKYAEETDSGGVVTIDPRMIQNLGIRTAAVERLPLAREVRVAGDVAVNENRIEVVQTRAAGWVEKLHVRAVNDPVRKGQLLAEVYSPDLYAAEQEYLLALRAQDSMLRSGARQRLLLLGLSPGQVSELEQTGRASKRVAYYAPVDGVVTELGVREGAQVNPGMSLYTLADLSKVWINAAVPEAQAAGLIRGTRVDATISALAGHVFRGAIDYVYPTVNLQTRTVQVRAVFDNQHIEHDLLLKPGMFAEVLLGQGQTRDALVVPSEALIRTGTRTTVIVAEAEGRFRPVEVKLGMQHGGHTEILEGLSEGQHVVASGQFLIDSEANLRGAFNKLEAAPEMRP